MTPWFAAQAASLPLAASTPAAAQPAAAVTQTPVPTPAANGGEKGKPAAKRPEQAGAVARAVRP